MDHLSVFSCLWVVCVPFIKEKIFRFKLFKFLRTYACSFSGSCSGEADAPGGNRDPRHLLAAGETTADVRTLSVLTSPRCPTLSPQQNS